MDRRKAIKSILALGVVAGLPFPDVFPQELIQTHTTKKRIYKNFHVVGLGGGGCMVLEHYYKQGLQAEYTCIAAEELPNLPSRIKYINFSPFKQVNSEDDWSNYHLALPAKVKSVFESNELFIILVGLGGTTGTLLGKSVFHYLKYSNNDFVFICSFPFSFEGKKRKVHAMSAFEELKEYKQFKSFRLDDIRNEYGDLTLSEAFQKANEYSYKVFMNTI